MVTPRARKGMPTSLPEPSQVSSYGKAAVKGLEVEFTLDYSDGH